MKARGEIKRVISFIINANPVTGYGVHMGSVAVGDVIPAAPDIKKARYM
jgi:hypothetical protein